MGEAHSLQATLHHMMHMFVTAVLKMYHQKQTRDEMEEVGKVTHYNCQCGFLSDDHGETCQSHPVKTRVKTHKYLLQTRCSLAVF